MNFKLNMKHFAAAVIIVAFVGSFWSTQAELSNLRNITHTYYGAVQSKITSLETKVAHLEGHIKGDSNEQLAKELLKKFLDELKEKFK